MSRGPGNRYSNRYHADQRMQRERAAERRQDGLNKMLQDHNYAAAHCQSESRAENMRRQREEAQERREIWTDYQYVKREQELEVKKHRAEMEDRLASELHTRRVVAAREAAERQRICDNSEELRALKGRLATAEANKVRAKQLLEQQLQEQEEEKRELQFIEHIESRRLQELELERKLEEEKLRQRISVNQTNQKQIAGKEQQRQEQGMRQYLHDKAEVDALVARISEEDKAHSEARRAKVEAERQAIEEQRRLRQAQNEALERWEVAQDAQIENFARKKKQQEDDIVRQKEEQEKERRRILHQMLNEQVSRKREADNRQRIIDDYHQEQFFEAQRRREAEDARKKEEDKKLLQRRYEEHVTQKEDRQRRQVEEEQRFREELLAKFAEDDRVEQMNDQKRRMKLLEHRREVDRQIKERREAYEAARQRELQEMHREQESENERQRVIEEERQRLLAEAAPLKRFFPKGVLESPSDFEVVGEEPPTWSRPEIGRSASVGRTSNMRHSASAGHLRPASLGPGRPAGMRCAWGTPPGSPGREARQRGGVASSGRSFPRPPLLGGAGLSI